MTARRKKPVRARRITSYQPWDADFADLFILSDGWTPPAEVKLVHGRTSGTLSGAFRDEKGKTVEAYVRFRLNKAGGGEITERGLRASYRWPAKGGAE